MDNMIPFKKMEYVPVVLGAASFLVLCIHVGVVMSRKGEPKPDIQSTSRQHWGPEYADSLKLRTWLQWIRLVLCLALFSVSISQLVLVLTRVRLVDICLLAFFIYSGILSSLTVMKEGAFDASVHVTVLHAIAFLTFSFLDLSPLAYTQPNGTWNIPIAPVQYLRVTLLSITGILIPLLLPRNYVPLDPSNPRPPALHQIASPLSFSYFTFLDPLVWKAFKNRKGSGSSLLKDIPRLAEDDSAQYQSKQSFAIVDPVMANQKRSIARSMIIYFNKQYFIMTIVTLIQVTTDFAWPLATNRILNFLESSPQSPDAPQTSALKPWVWILWLTLGPIFGTFLNEMYEFYITVVLSRMQAILSQLLLVHALRVRLNTITPLSKSKKSPPASTKKPDDPAIEHDSSSSSSNAITSADIAEEKEDYIGKINNLLSSDLEWLFSFQEWMRPAILGIHAMMCMLLLYFILGWSALVGLATMLCGMPIPYYLGKRIRLVQQGRMKKADSRVAAVSQTMNVIRMIKLFAWEEKVKDRIFEKREEELRYIFWNVILDCVSMILNLSVPLATKIVTYAVYTLVMGEELVASKLFSSLVLFNILANDVHVVFWKITFILRSKVSLDRIGDFLNSGELYHDPSFQHLPSSDHLGSAIIIRDAIFRWQKSFDGSTISSTPASSMNSQNTRRAFTLRIPGTLTFKPSTINLICGPTASGKTSLLMALLGEMYFEASSESGFYHLPRENGIAYAAQESWVLNDTIRGNILFGKEYDQERFEKTIYQTGLSQDLEIGGQKARITLARAVYSSAQIVLLDDVLSALDAHTARWVATNCLGGDLLEGRTVLLVTNNILLCEPFAGRVISIGKDGVISSQETVQEALTNDRSLRETVHSVEEIRKEESVIGNSSETIASADEAEKQPDGKLIVAEDMADGHLSWSACLLWFKHFSGPLFFTYIAFNLLLQSLVSLSGNWFLGWWSTQYIDPPASGVPNGLYLGIYSLIALADVLILMTSFGVWEIGGIRASRALHQELMSSVLSATLRWLDTVPISRVITRSSQDFQSIDGPLLNLSYKVAMETTRLTMCFITIVASAGSLTLVPGIIVLVFGLAFGHVFIKAQLPLKRLRSNARSPVLSHVGAALHGLVSIRAYGAQEAVLKESLLRIDNFTRVNRTYENLWRWVALRTKTLGSLFTGAVAAYLVYGRELSAARIGFTLTLIATWTDLLLAWIRDFNDLEVQGNSVERIKDFLEIDHEPQPTEEGKPPAYWPASRELQVEDLFARYSMDGPVVLNNISFSLKSGQRLGIVGRTGAGKSSIALALLRAIPTTGSVRYDEIETSKLNLDVLRSNITIIPQHPELLVGTIRENLDPFGEHEDAALTRRSALDTDVSASGSNFSQGQRQILALARAILRRSKIVVLDEATAAIDHTTDHVIQESLKTELKDVTVITVAHRLQSIMQSDKIMVLEKGEVVEFDSPSALLLRGNGFFKSLVNASPDRADLLAAAGVPISA
ncbi:P-loop containing nucleoside triphosphate hydrolase protein [Sistotremastrum niveocremeum HHB9708]|uniref:p-loop containing nucleoside triphosphate hydrolase protein n=1 Tax=Sistotremastrum niveocremeum HHB9708 TaxID=1314777 RepID=A0A164Y458_9AGAM|nr:P-loop containing nucleoside triphosphate hydrolase protein [Sistotremastrum niveocremeum HHB9708]